MVYNNILEAVGNTPMIRLCKMPEEGSAQVLVKMEALNVGGSIKTRTALNMIEQAERDGLIGEDTIIVEPTSGNQGIGLALVGAVKGYKTIIIMPDSVSEERRKLVRQYGAEVVLIHDAGDIGACIDECLKTALRMRSTAFAPGSAQGERSPGSERCSGRSIPISRSGRLNPRTPRSWQEELWELTCRWGSATESFPISSTRRSMTIYI